MLNETTEQAENNTDEQFTELNPKWKDVMDLLITGMGKSKAYKAIYPKCNSTSSACKQVRTILADSEAKAYYEQEIEHKKYYVDQKNQLTINGAVAANMRILKLAENLANNAEKQSDQINAMNTAMKIIDSTVKQLGLGTYDPAIKYQIETAQNELKKIQQAKELEAPKKDDALAKLLAPKPKPQTITPNSSQEPIIETSATSIIQPIINTQSPI